MPLDSPEVEFALCWFCLQFAENISITGRLLISGRIKPELKLPSVPLHPAPAFSPLPFNFLMHPSCDPEFSGVPEAIHLAGEVCGELG